MIVNKIHALAQHFIRVLKFHFLKEQKFIKQMEMSNNCHLTFHLSKNIKSILIIYKFTLYTDNLHQAWFNVVKNTVKYLNKKSLIMKTITAGNKLLMTALWWRGLKYLMETTCNWLYVKNWTTGKSIKYLIHNVIFNMTLAPLPHTYHMLTMECFSRLFIL